MPNNVRNILDLAIDKKNLNSRLFKDESYFSKSFIPNKVLFRERQFRELIIKFKRIINSNETYIDFFQAITFLGPVGTGKSLVARYFCFDFIKTLQLKFSKITFLYRHLNCRRNKSIFTLLFDLLRSIVPHFPNRGFSSSELMNMLHVLLINTNAYLFLILDEIDFLFQDKEIRLFFENLTFKDEISETKSNNRISVIYITRNKNFLLLLDTENKFHILDNIIKFDHYKRDEIKEILMHRASYGLREGIISISTFDYLADYTYQKNDIRFGIELLWRSTRVAESENSQKLDLVHVKKAFSLMEEV